MAEKSSHLQITYWGEDSPPFLLDKSDYLYYASYGKGGGAVAEAKITVLTIREWPVDLHRQMRSEAAIKGITLREAMIEAARLWLRTKGKEG